jgi:hypothetical protein
LVARLLNQLPASKSDPHRGQLGSVTREAGNEIGR